MDGPPGPPPSPSKLWLAPWGVLEELESLSPGREADPDPGTVGADIAESLTLQSSKEMRENNTTLHK